MKEKETFVSHFVLGEQEDNNINIHKMMKSRVVALLFFIIDYYYLDDLYISYVITHSTKQQRRNSK